MPNLIDRVLPIPNSSYEIGLEHLPGAVRHWGKKYAKKLAIGYGHIRNTLNPSDGKALDCYIHPGLIEGDRDSARLFQVDQLNQDGGFDEPKLMIGFGSASEAEAAYLREMPRSFFGGIAEIGEEAIEAYRKERAVEFAAKSTAKAKPKAKQAIAGKPQKKCVKGYSCGYSCIQKAKACSGNRLVGQAATYAKFLSAAIKAGKTLSAPHQADAATAGLLNKTAKPAAKKTVTPAPTPIAAPAPTPIPASAATPTQPKLTMAQIQQAQQQSNPAPKAQSSPAIAVNQANLDKTRTDLVDRFGEKLVSGAEENVQKILKDSSVFVRVGSNDTLEKILGSRFMTAHDLSKTAHDIPHLQDNYLEARARVEAKSLGYDEKTKPGDRPIYGYFGGDNLNGESHTDAGEAYGAIAVKLKPEAKARATFTGCDSFKSGIASELNPDGTPPPPNAASLVSVTRHGYDNDNLPSNYPSHYKAFSSKALLKTQLTTASKVKTIDDLPRALAPTGASYVEAQIHGQVKPEDLAEIHYTPSGTEKPSPKVAQFCKDNGVALFVGGKQVNPDDILKPPKPASGASDAQQISDAIESGDMAAVVQATEALRQKADQVQMAPGEPKGATVLKALIQSAGFDAKPKVGTEAELDAEVAKNATMMVRGVMPPASGDKLAYLKQFQAGDYHIGAGMYGHGTYVGHSGKIQGNAFIPGNSPADNKRAVDRVSKHGYINSKTVNFRMALADDAVVATQSVLEKEQRAALVNLSNWRNAEVAKVKATATSQKSDGLKAIDRAVDDALSTTKITKISALATLGFVDSKGRKVQSVEVSYQTLQSKPKKASTYYIELPNGNHEVTDPNTSEAVEIKGGIDALHAHILRGAIQDAEAKKAGFYNYNAAAKLGVAFDPVTAQKIQQIEDQHKRADAVLDNLSHFAVIKGYDAIALDGSYAPDTFMNVLNRGKITIQDTPLKLKTAKQKGLS